MGNNRWIKGNRLKNVDIEFRDSINAWIEDTIDEADRKKHIGKKNEANAVYTLSSIQLTVLRVW
mgnify:CR=1 FL=1